MADAHDLDSCGPRPSGFDSRLAHLDSKERSPRYSREEERGLHRTALRPFARIISRGMALSRRKMVEPCRRHRPAKGASRF